MKKFLKKKNNKGFSLVELIVVILIIAIIAVALAPQVIKWVGEASDSTKKSNQATIQTAIQTAAADLIGHGGTIDDAGITVSVTRGAATITGTTTAGTSGSLQALINAAIQGNTDSNTYTYTVNSNGVVTVTAS